MEISTEHIRKISTQFIRQNRAAYSRRSFVCSEIWYCRRCDARCVCSGSRKVVDGRIRKIPAHGWSPQDDLRRSTRCAAVLDFYRMNRMKVRRTSDGRNSWKRILLILLRRSIKDRWWRTALIFTCCHPALSPDARIALTLREVCDLTTEEIAHAFLTTPTTLAQRMSVQNQRSAMHAYRIKVPEASELPKRLDTVLMYLFSF